MNTLNFIKEKYQLSYDVPMPIILRRIGRHSGFKELLKELDFRTGAEIGTKEGNYARELCVALPKLKLYCIDPWKAYDNYQESWAEDQKTMDALFKRTKKRLSGFNCEIIRKTSMEAVRDFKPNSLDFVFIDGNHEYSYVLDDIVKWTQVLRSGGVIFGHDYTPNHQGVMQAVQEYIGKNNICPWFILRVGGSVVDCWMFVKPE